MTETILVTGATGNVGRHVVAGLRDMGADGVRALVRDPARATLPDGVGLARGDLTDPASLDAAAEGADTVFLLWPSLRADGAAAAVTALAKHVRRIVYLSAISVRDDAPPEENGVWGRVEQAVERSGADWTFLRAGGFAANTLGWAGEIRAAGVVRWVYGQAARSLIHERDIADVAVRALTDTAYDGGKYVLTGPEAITQEEQARAIGEAIGRPVRWEEIPPGAIRGQMLGFMGDPAAVDRALGYWAGLTEHPEPVTHTVEEITGAPARTFREWARDHAADFR